MEEIAKKVNIEAVLEPVRYVLYARKSSEADELQALSIDSQIKEMKEMALRENLNIVEVRKESHSAKDSGQRPVFNQIIEDIKVGKFNGLICWAPDRLSRNAGDLGRAVDLMDQGLLKDIRTHGQRFTDNPNEKFLLMILGSQAKLENDHKGENVKRGLRAKCEQGYRPGVSPLGYLHDKYADKGSKRIILDPERAPIIKEMFEKVAHEEWHGRQLFAWLIQRGVTTRTGKRVALSAIYRILADTFYYGEFEYPIGSGNWYKGAYEPLITKELFLKARANLMPPPKRHPATKEFDFTKMMKCGGCGAGICAEEKFKRPKNGKVHRYVYYHCTRGKDRNCKEGSIREEELIRQLQQLIDKIDIDEIGMREQIDKEVRKYRKFAYGVLGEETEFDKRGLDADIRKFAKYVLYDGSRDQKRELLNKVSSKLTLVNKEVHI